MFILRSAFMTSVALLHSIPLSQSQSWLFLLPLSNLFSASYLQKYWLQLQSVNGIKQRPSFAIMIKMWLQMPALATAWSLTIALKPPPPTKKVRVFEAWRKTSETRRGGSIVALWSLLFLCAVCNRSEEHVPLRNAPRLLQLMTAGGSSLGAVWQHLLRH